MLAGGVMPSEIGRLDPEEAVRTLSSATPYVTIGAEGVVKKEARRRIVPLPWSAEVLQAVIRHLPTAIVRANTTTNPSAVVNKWLRQRDFNATGHSLRHTMQAAASASMANPLALARIGGWSGAGLNTTMLTYGAGVDDSELVQSLMAESRRWFKHCVPDAGHGLRLVAGDALLRE
jgi:integrase